MKTSHPFPDIAFHVEVRVVGNVDYGGESYSEYILLEYPAKEGQIEESKKLLTDIFTQDFKRKRESMM